MSFRCINAFAYGETVYPNGYEAADDDPVLKTHADHFAEVDVPLGRAVEQAVAEPGGLRAASPKKKAPAKKAPPKDAPEPETPDAPAEDHA